MGRSRGVRTKYVEVERSHIILVFLHLICGLTQIQQRISHSRCGFHSLMNEFYTKKLVLDSKKIPLGWPKYGEVGEGQVCAGQG